MTAAARVKPEDDVPGIIAAAHRDSGVLDRLRMYGAFRGEVVSARNIQRVFDAFDDLVVADVPDFSALTFRSPIEIADALPDEPPAIWRGYLYPGTVTILAGKPKCGKSTLVSALLAALAAGDDEFLGEPIKATPSVFVTEESDITAAPKLPRTAQVRVLTRDSAWPKPNWATTIAAAAAEAEKFGCRLMVIDTFSFWAQLAADKEKDAGAVGLALDVLIEAASSNALAVLLVHHAKKGGGEDGESLRGSSAIAGAVDVILELDRPADETHIGQRVLLGLSRFPGTPASLLIERTAAGDWHALGQSESRSGAQAIAMREELVDLLQRAPDGLTRVDIIEETGHGWPKLLRGLEALTRAGQVSIEGEGRKGSPRRYKFCTCAPNRNVQKSLESDQREVSGFCIPPEGGHTETEPSAGDAVRSASILSEQQSDDGDADLAERLRAKYEIDAA